MSETLELADENIRQNLPSEQCILDRYENSAALDGKAHWYEGGSHRSMALCLLIKQRGFGHDEGTRLRPSTAGYCFYDEPYFVYAAIEELAKTAHVVVASYRGPPSICDPSRWVHYVWTGTEYTPKCSINKTMP